MPQIGPLEIMVVSVLALIVFGPQKLPELARSAGKGLKQLRSMAQEVKSEFDLSSTGDVPAEAQTPSVTTENKVEAVEAAESGSSPA